MSNISARRLGGTIYAIAMENTGLVKIGFTRQLVMERLKDLQQAQPLPLRLVASLTIETFVAPVEHCIHRFLAKYRRQGEWFEIAMDVRTLGGLVLRALQEIEALAQRKAAEARASACRSYGRNWQYSRLAAMLAASGKTRHEVASDIGCTNQCLYELAYLDQPYTLDMLQRLAAYFQVTPAYIYPLLTQVPAPRSWKLASGETRSSSMPLSLLSDNHAS